MAEEALLTALERGEAFGRPGETVERLETHISWLFLCGDRVYKLKKPVELDFLDASTLERRRELCEAEVRLNRRLAPDTYLGVVAIARDPDGTIRLGGPGEVIEHAVEMRRLPSERMMDRLLERGEIDSGTIRELAALLADFHARAATGPRVNRHGQPSAIRDVVVSNLEHLAQREATALHRHLREAIDAFLEDERDLLESRVAAGRIREGHGDLHAGNICLLESGPVIYDCIEFSEAFRCGDVATDLAFLTMDLDRRCFRAFGGELVHRYAESAGDPELPRLMGFYALHRALVRARVAELSERDEERSEYLALAASYTLGPALLLTCGLPGSGKSHVARALARPFEAAVVTSDLVRKRLAGIPATHHPHDEIDRGLYDREHTARTYGALLEEADGLLAAGRSVVVDATFSSAERRRPFVELARRRGVPLLLVEVVCEESVALERIARRALDPRAVSDADARVYASARAAFQPPDEIDARSRRVHDGTTPARFAVEGAIGALVALHDGPGRLRPPA